MQRPLTQIDITGSRISTMISKDTLSGDSRRISGGRISLGADGPAFTFAAPESMPLPVLIAVPHAGRNYPREVWENLRDPEMSARRLEDRFIDRVGIAIARQTGSALLMAKAPRAMLDLNRSSDDIDWSMISGSREQVILEPVGNRRARTGLGLVPRRLPGFGEIWKSPLSKGELDLRIDNIHRPYHSFLEQELLRLRDQWGAVLLIDLHSMPPLKAKVGQSRAPEFVIGDRFGSSCASSLVGAAVRYLEGQGCAVAHNRPYSGGYVLDRHSSPARGIHAVQLEVCRAEYLDKALDQVSDRLPSLAQILAEFTRLLGAETARLGANGQFAQAAE